MGLPLTPGSSGTTGGGLTAGSPLADGSGLIPGEGLTEGAGLALGSVLGLGLGSWTTVGREAEESASFPLLEVRLPSLLMRMRSSCFMVTSST